MATLLQGALLCILSYHLYSAGSEQYFYTNDTSITSGDEIVINFMPIEHSYLYCVDTRCTVDCSASYGCSNMTIDAHQSKYLSVYCDELGSCAYINIIPASEATEISCTHRRSCEQANIRGDAVNGNTLIYIQCSDPCVLLLLFV